jgi:hypothetical protein
MRPEAKSRFAIGALILALAGCEAAPHQPAGVATTALAPADDGDPRPETPPTAIDWAGAGDCLAQLRLLHATAGQGRLDERQGTPFAVVLVAPTTSLEWIEAPVVPVVGDLPLPSFEDAGAASAAAPCLLLVEPARDLRAAHRVVDLEDVASEYQSGVRSERNPDYDAAQARVRDAERADGKGGPGVLRVGDPMLDLVGLLVGGVIATFGDLGDGDLDDALSELKETPRSRDRPIYRAYQFERSTVRAGKEAIIPIALRDLRRNRIRRTELRQREMREFAVLEGLDPRDPDYEQHRAGGLSWREFEHWERQPPKLPISAIVAALVEPGAAREPADENEAPAGNQVDAIAESGSALDAGGTAAAGHATTAEPRTRLTAVTALAPMAGPDASPPGERPVSGTDERMPLRSGMSAARASPEAGEGRLPGLPTGSAAMATASDLRVASVVRLRAGSHRGNGFYVKPRLVVTAADVVGTASVVEVTTSDGQELLGLVVLTDPARKLAVIHVPRAGPATPFAETPELAPGRAAQVVELAGDGRARVIPAALEAAPPSSDPSGDGALAPHLQLQDGGEHAVAGAPIFLGDRAVGLVADPGGAPTGSVIAIDEIAELLESEALAALH